MPARLCVDQACVPPAKEKNRTTFSADCAVQIAYFLFDKQALHN
jgi:hypothetical protein